MEQVTLVRELQMHGFKCAKKMGKRTPGKVSNFILAFPRKNEGIVRSHLKSIQTLIVLFGHLYYHDLDFHTKKRSL